jgi:hypothetical protein
MTTDGKIEQFARHFLYLLYSRIAEFKHFTAILTDQVVVLSEFV